MDGIFCEPSASLAVCFFVLLDLLLSYAGGALGSAVGWWMTRGKFRPLYQIIIEMTPEEKKKLYSEVMAVLGNLAWDNLPELIVKVMCNSTLEKQIFDILISFARKQLRVKVKY